MREVTFEVLCDPSMFTPVQLQPRFLMSMAFNAWSRWTRQHFVPLATMIQQYQFGVVVVGGQLEFLEPVGFFDAESGEVRARVRSRLNGAYFQIEFSATSIGRRTVRGMALLMPVKIDDLHSLNASPARLSAELLSMFESDELDASAPQRPVPPLVASVEKTGTLVAESTYPFTVFRHACEMADQWCAVQIPCLVSEARETLSLSQNGRDGLRRQINQPLRYFDMELLRPMYVFDKGSIGTRVYKCEDRHVFVHRLYSAHHEHAVVVERF